MLPTNFSTLQQAVRAWEGIAIAPHRFGGVEFKLGKVEIGHIHRNGMVDVPFTRKLRAALVAEGAAQPHHLLADSGWISYYIRDDGDMAGALALLHLSYLHKRHHRGQVAAAEALTALPFSASIKQAAFGT